MSACYTHHDASCTGVCDPKDALIAEFKEKIELMERDHSVGKCIYERRSETAEAKVAEQAAHIAKLERLPRALGSNLSVVIEEREEYLTGCRLADEERRWADSCIRAMMSLRRAIDDALAPLKMQQEARAFSGPAFTCPNCGGHYFGTSSCDRAKSEWRAHCHDQNKKGCRWSGPHQEHVRQVNL